MKALRITRILWQSTLCSRNQSVQAVRSTYASDLSICVHYPGPAQSQDLSIIFMSKLLAFQLPGLLRTISDIVMASNLSLLTHLALVRLLSELKPV